METPCRAFLVTTAFLCLSGCAVGPDYESPAIAVPNVFGTASSGPPAASPPVTADFVRWWQVLHDPQLDQLVEMAVARNLDIEIALTRVQEARSQQIVVLGGMLPGVGGSGTVATGSGTDITRGRVTPSIRAGDVTTGVRSIWRMFGFDARWELDLFGKHQRQLEAAYGDAEAQMELRNAVLITVIADVARNYLDIRALQIRREIVRKDVATAQRMVDLLATKLERGPSGESDPASTKRDERPPTRPGTSSASDESDLAPTKPDERTPKRQSRSSASNESDLALAKGELATQQAKLPELNAAIFAAESRLAVLLGTYAADVAGAIQGPAKLPRLPERLRPGVPVDLLRRRPDIRVAERELAAATARIGVATADLFPSVSLTAGYGVQGETWLGNAAVPLHGPIWSVGPAVYWPLLDFGRLDALINIEEMRTHEVLVRYKKTIIAAVAEVDQAIELYRLDLQRLKALAAAYQEISLALALTMERYKRGETDFRALLEVQRRDYAIAEQAAIAAEAVVVRYVAFYKALGGGWELYDELPPVPPAQPAAIATVERLTGGWHH